MCEHRTILHITSSDYSNENNNNFENGEKRFVMPTTQVYNAQGTTYEINNWLNKLFTWEISIIQALLITEKPEETCTWYAYKFM